MGVIALTGATGALGEILAADLVARGHRVAAFGRASSRERLEALARRLGSACAPIVLDPDSATPEGWSVAFSAIESALGAPPEGAVLAAGGWQGGKPFHEEPDTSAFRAMFDSNLEPAERTMRALLPGMVERRRGSIVVIGSRASARPWTSTGASGYAASKAALSTLAEVIAAEVRDFGVRINVVLPSTIDTQANRRAMPETDPSRWVSPQSLAAVVAFLLSDDARDVSGAQVPVYGKV